MLVHALSISFATAQSSHNSEIYNITCAVDLYRTREPGNHDNGASDVWTLTAYCICNAILPKQWQIIIRPYVIHGKVIGGDSENVYVLVNTS